MWLKIVALVIEWWPKIVEFLKRWWPQVSLACAIIFAYLWWTAAADLRACRGGMAAQNQAFILKQESDQKALANCKGRVVVKPGAVAPGSALTPCSEVTVDFEGNGSSHSVQTQYVTVTAKCPSSDGLAIFGGLGTSLSSPMNPHAQLGVRYYNASIYVQKPIEGDFRAGANWEWRL
jgi:hypothetical protein